VQPKTLTEAIGNLRIVFLVTIVAATLFGLAIAFVLSRSVTTSVAHVAEAASVLAQGDLNRRVPPSGKDELGMLAQSFNTMVDNLKKLIRRIRDAYLRVEEGREQIRESTVAVLQASKAQVSSLEEVSSAINQMNTSAKEVAENVENLSFSAEQTSSSVMEMASSIDEVSDHIKSLSNSVDETAALTARACRSIPSGRSRSAWRNRPNPADRAA